MSISDFIARADDGDLSPLGGSGNVADQSPSSARKRPSVISAQALSRCFDLRYDVG